MKRFFTFLLIAFGVAPLLYSQVTMTKTSHGFFSGQNHECQAVQYQLPGESGKNRVWDFSKATLLEETKSVANLSDEIYGPGTVKADRDDGCEFFFNTTENANEYWGYQAGNTKLQFTEPIVKTRYPQTFDTKFAGRFAGTQTVEGTNYKRQIEGTYSTHADAIGTIILPGDVSMPALRVKTIETYPTYECIKYLWYAQDVRLPLFITFEDYSIAADGTKKLKTTKSFLNTQAKNRIAANIADDFLYQVYPNPFRGNIQLTYFLPEKALVTVELLASSGAKLATLVSNQEQIGVQTLSHDVSKHAQQPGIYLLRLTVGDKTYTEKLVKTY